MCDQRWAKYSNCQHSSNKWLVSMAISGELFLMEGGVCNQKQVQCVRERGMQEGCRRDAGGMQEGCRTDAVHVAIDKERERERETEIGGMTVP